MFNSYKTPFLKSRPGWLPTSFLSTSLKLNFSSLVFLRSSLKLTILLHLCLQALLSNLLLRLELLVLSLTHLFFWSHLIHLKNLLRSHWWSQTYSQYYFRSHYRLARFNLFHCRTLMFEKTNNWFKLKLFGVPYLQIFAHGTALQWFYTYYFDLQNQQNYCRPHLSRLPFCADVTHLGYSVPSRVLRAHGTSLYHLLPRPQQSHLLPEAMFSWCHRQQTTTPEHKQSVLSLNPATFLRELRFIWPQMMLSYRKDVWIIFLRKASSKSQNVRFKLLTNFLLIFDECEHSIFAQIAKNSDVYGS